MAKDVKMQKGQDIVTVNENNVAHYEKLGYKIFTSEIKIEAKETKTYGDSSRKRGSSKDWK